jgi:hypothetical protein
MMVVHDGDKSHDDLDDDEWVVAGFIACHNEVDGAWCHCRATEQERWAKKLAISR